MSRTYCTLAHVQSITHPFSQSHQHNNRQFTSVILTSLTHNLTTLALTGNFTSEGSSKPQAWMSCHYSYFHFSQKLTTYSLTKANMIFSQLTIPKIKDNYLMCQSIGSCFLAFPVILSKSQLCCY